MSIQQTAFGALLTPSPGQSAVEPALPGRCRTAGEAVHAGLRLLEPTGAGRAPAAAEPRPSQGTMGRAWMGRHAGSTVLSGYGDPGTPRPALPEGTAPPRIGAGTADTPLRSALRTATQEAHDRLHRHDGFAAIQDATIGLADYRKLIVRLYGFYVPFEAAAGIGPDRSGWLAGDLEALGLGRPLHALPRCPHVPRLDDAHLRLGALYMAEGSALGGRELARGLDRLLGKGVPEGRRFLIGRGAGTGEAWRGYLARLSAAPPGPSARAEITKGAVETFAAFEHWMDGWSTLSHG